MNTKKLKINIPEGYEIDRENSTFEEIVFKKKVDHFSRLPKTWEEYCRLNHLKDSFSPVYGNCSAESSHTGSYDEFHTKERAEQFIALGRLLQLRDYWVGDWKINSDNIYVIYKNVIIATVHNNDFPLAFPTREMAKEFKNCFEDLIKEAYPLV